MNNVRRSGALAQSASPCPISIGAGGAQPTPIDDQFASGTELRLIPHIVLECVTRLSQSCGGLSPGELDFHDF
ncbi:hypothetical protein, partial [Nocardia seriolae]|uniref:hypothetical protein n=1 Tax=Nocardia seriolae TaxID=37332 RepID=UPI001C0DAD49